MSFKKHIDEKIIKAKKNIGIIKHLSKFIPLKTLDQMYKALVRPQLPALNSLMEKIERVQYQAALAVTGAWQGSNCSKLNEELGWETLSDRRMGRWILQIHKIMNNRTPSYLKDKLPPPNHRALSNRPLVNVFREIKIKSDRNKNSFFPDAISSWNKIISHFGDFPSFDILKNYVISFFRPKKKSIFGVHDPIGLRYLFQLRVSLSPLRSHKSRHNFIDTPSDICHCNQGVEDTSRFLFFCPSYVTQRATLATSVNEILLKNNLHNLENQSQLYLYGHEPINYAENRNILISTLKYIKDTPRFST